MPRRLAIVERPEQLRLLQPGDGVLSTSPLVGLAAEDQGVEAMWIDDYVDGCELEELGMASYATVERLCEALDQLARGIAGIDGPEVVPARWHFLWLKIIYDAITLRAHALRQVVDAERPDELLWFERSGPATAPISDDETVYGPVAEIAGPQLGVKVSALPPAAAPPASGRGSRVGPLATALGGEVRAALRRLGRRRGRVLALDLSYGMPPIARELQRLGWDVVLWTGVARTRSFGWPRPRQHEPERAASRLDAQQMRAAANALPDAAEAFRWGGFDLWPAARGFIGRLTGRAFSDAIDLYIGARAVLRDVTPGAVLMSMAAHPRERAACAAARAHGVPSVVSRHGELGIRDLPMPVYEDVDVVDCVLAWGEWEARWVERHARREVRTVTVGSPMTEDIVRRARPRTEARRMLGLDPAQRIALVLPTLYTGNLWYAGWRHPPDGDYFRHQTRVLEALLAVDGLHILIKEHLGVPYSVIGRWAARAAPGRTTVIRTPPFGELIHVADIAVLDPPGTSLPEAAFGSSALYLVDHPLIKWEPGVREHLEAHGMAVCEPGELTERINRDIASGRLDGPLSYPPELRAPLAAAGELGTSAAERAARAVASIAGGHAVE